MFSELGVQEQTSDENNKTMHEQTRALTKKQNHQKKVLELKDTVAEMKDSLVFNSRLDQAKERNPPFATTWMNPEGIMLSKISQTQKDKYCMISLICGIPKSQTQTNENGMVVARD